jgi:hypothetical protein
MDLIAAVWRLWLVMPGAAMHQCAQSCAGRPNMQCFGDLQGESSDAIHRSGMADRGLQPDRSARKKNRIGAGNPCPTQNGSAQQRQQAEQKRKATKQKLAAPRVQCDDRKGGEPVLQRFRPGYHRGLYHAPSRAHRQG